MMIPIEDLERRLAEIERVEWQKLFDLMPALENEKTFGEMVLEGKSDDGTIQMPYYSHNEITGRLLSTLHEMNILPNFNWTDWKEGKEILSNLDEHIDILDLMTICKLLTLIVRQDRFYEGFLIMNLEEGRVLRLIQRMKGIINQD